MRVPVLVLALIAMPFMASVSQSNSKQGSASRAENSARKSDARQDNVQQQGQHDDDDNKKCDTKAKSVRKDKENGHRNGHDDARSAACAPSKPVTPVAPVGLAQIHGVVFGDLDADGRLGVNEVGLAGITVQITGPVSASTTTDATGAYAFTGLPVGIYTVCQSAPRQSSPTSGPACAAGAGWLLDVPASMPDLWYGSIDFGILQ